MRRPSVFSLSIVLLPFGFFAGVTPASGQGAETETASQAPSAPPSLSYHGIPLFWPVENFKLPLTEVQDLKGETAWLWLETLGGGRLRLEDGLRADATIDFNPELSALVKTWRWDRYPLSKELRERGHLRIRASPWGDVFLGRSLVTDDPNLTPAHAEKLRLEKGKQLQQGKAEFPATPFTWSATVLEIKDKEGRTVERTVVDREGFFSGLVPEDPDLTAVLLDRDGKPLSEPAPLIEADGNPSFVPLPNHQPLLWFAAQGGAGLSFRWIRNPQTGALPEFLAFQLRDSGENPSPLEPYLLAYCRVRPSLLIQPILSSHQPLSARMEETLLGLRDTLADSLQINPARCLLVAEYGRSSEALMLASAQRDRIGAAVVWGGTEGKAIPSNFKNLPVAYLGDRQELKALSKWCEACQQTGCPVLIKSYWSNPTENDLEKDVGESLDWVLMARKRGLEREIDHSTYLPEFGRYQWIWITGLPAPGRLGRVKARWSQAGIIRLEAEGADKVRVFLNCGLGHFGQRVTLILDSLTLPITLGSKFQAVELSRRSDDGRWLPRFLDFGTPLPSIHVATIPASGFPKGSELEAFARYARTELRLDCAWGYRWEHAMEPGILTDRDLYERVSPDLYRLVRWPPDVIDRFHEWRGSRESLSLEISGYTPGLSSPSPADRSATLKCAIPQKVLEEFLTESGDLPAESEPLTLNQMELVGMYLKKQFR